MHLRIRDEGFRVRRGEARVLETPREAAAGSEPVILEELSR